jgi:hypothetical protein
MKRRSYLKTMLAAGAGLGAAQAQSGGNPIVLYVDMPVDPAKEKLMIKNFHEIFKPAAEKHEGYIDLKIVKIRSAPMGTPPAGINYRFQLTFKSEELRQKWISSAVHQRVWPTIENTFTTKNYQVLLCDSV